MHKKRTLHFRRSNVRIFVLMLFSDVILLVSLSDPIILAKISEKENKKGRERKSMFYNKVYLSFFDIFFLFIRFYVFLFL